MHDLTIEPSAMTLLVPLYNSPGRHYHNLDHINFLISKLTEYDSVNSMTYSDFICLKYAIWFHDAIYSPYSSSPNSNELQSASLFSRFFYQDKFKYEITDHMHDQIVLSIRMTEYHLSDISDMNIPNKNKDIVNLMLDLDLSGFAKPYHLVYNDSAKIFKEYEILGFSLDEMMKSRIKFLQLLLNKERIFYTEYFHNTYENIARENIEEVITRTYFELGTHDE